MKIKRYVRFSVMIVVISLAESAKGGISFYTDRSTWEAEVSGAIETETFDEITPHVLTEGVNSAGLIDIELLNLVEENVFNFFDGGVAWSGWTPFFQGSLRRNDPDARINLIFSSPVTAFSGDFESTDSVDGLWLEVNGTSYKFGDYLSSGDGTGFLGFTSTSSFSTLAFFDPVMDDPGNKIYRLGESFGMDNVSFVVVPEPMTMGLLGLGGLMLRKRRKV